MPVPLIHIQPKTAIMLADYHANTDSPETEMRWLRVALVLRAVESHNDCTYDNETFHGILDMAFSDNLDNIRTRARELI